MTEMDNSNIDRLITALYLAQSDTREKMLAALVEHVLYIANTSLRDEDINRYIKDNFHLEPIRFEITNTLGYLTESKSLFYNHPYYTLNDETKDRIYRNILNTKEQSDRRFNSFKGTIKEISQEDIALEATTKLWEVFNEYLLECFMHFGRKAIEIFLPYEEMSISEEESIHKIACEKLADPHLIKLFKDLVNIYPQKLSTIELRYLTQLASRAERFYSLGIEKSEYEKISSLQIKDLVIVLDTNILYSILNLRFHTENAAIEELLKLAQGKLIDLRLVYIRRTYSELHKAKQHLELSITKENFRPSQIKALLASNRLDSFARAFYECKLINNETPHPAEKIIYASDLLKSKGVNLYNHPFPKIDEDNAPILNERIKEYHDYQYQVNKHSSHHLSKPEILIQHDVYLREAVIELKNRYSNENELKFICLTLDRALMGFDRFHYKGKVTNIINPNFIEPSVFLKRIRPFIPIVTDNYRKAFLTSLTSASFELNNSEDNLLVQKTMTYFKNLGIENEEMIIDCIKRELFLEELSKLENPTEAEQFILSEVGRVIETVKLEKQTVEQTAQKVIEEQEKEFLRAEERFNNIVSQKESEIESIKSIKEQSLVEKQKIISQLNVELQVKEERIDNLTSRLSALEEYQIKLTKRQNHILEHEKWKADLQHFKKSELQKWQFVRRSNCWYLFFSALLMLAPIIIAATISIFRKSLEVYALNNHIKIPFTTIFFILVAIQLLELFARTYIINKEKVKSGWEWLISRFQRQAYLRILKENEIKSQQIFEATYPKPVEN